MSPSALCLISRLYNTLRVWRQGSQNRTNPPRLVTKQVLAFFLQILHLISRCNDLGIDLAINARLISPLISLTLSLIPRHKLPVFNWEYHAILQKAVFAQDDNKLFWYYDQRCCFFFWTLTLLADKPTISSSVLNCILSHYYRLFFSSFLINYYCCSSSS